MVQRACAEAIGVAGVGEMNSTLQSIMADPGADPALRIFAGRSLTRLTGVRSVSQHSLHALVEAARAESVE